MDIETFRSYCLSKKGATESTPFPKLPSVLVFKVMGKLFAVTDLDDYYSIALKFRTNEIEELKAKYSALESPSYFSPKHWCSVLLDGSLRNKEIFEFIDTSYRLIVSKLTKVQRRELEEL